LKSCSEDELLAELKKIETWTYGKCELYHWVDVLDLCDSILERACHKECENSWVLACDLSQNKQV
jgi:E3 ubiquitin-protein ligase HUWE1